MIQKFIRIIFLTLFLSVIAKFSFAQTTILLKKENGLYVVPCTVNGLKLEFIFETGASAVSISLTDALFMLKNGYLNSEDIVGSAYYSDAHGNVSEGTKINIRDIEFAGLKLKNVEATVVHNMDAPLLLGQSVISRLGKIQLDPSTNSLVILNGIQSPILNLERYYDSIAFNFYQGKQYTKAAEYYAKKLKVMSPDAPFKEVANSYYRAGKAYYFGGKYVTADSIFAQLSELSPNWPISYLFRAGVSSLLIHWIRHAQKRFHFIKCF